MLTEASYARKQRNVAYGDYGRWCGNAGMMPGAHRNVNTRAASWDVGRQTRRISTTLARKPTKTSSPCPIDRARRALARFISAATIAIRRGEGICDHAPTRASKHCSSSSSSRTACPEGERACSRTACPEGERAPSKLGSSRGVADVTSGSDIDKERNHISACSTTWSASSYLRN